MQGQESHTKPHGGGWFNRKLKIFILFLGLISFSNLIFSNNTFALFTPTLSASVDNTVASVNGNQVINSTNKTTEIPLNLTVNTNNKTGYTATLNSETDETALVNNDSTTNTKINSISSAGPLVGFSNNTWGVKVGSNTNFSPIPKPTTPMNVRQTTWRTYSNDTNSIKIGMKLSDNLESGRYTNKLIFSILTNNYDPIAIMTRGWGFHVKLRSLETATNKIEHFKKSPVAPATSMNVVNIEDEESDYEIKLWLDPTNKTAYYYAEPEKVYLNEDAHSMFNLGYDGREVNILSLDLSNFDTSRVTDMSSMFSNMFNLTSLNLSNFDTSRVTDMNSMFRNMFNLTSLNLSNFNTSKVTNMDSMFDGMHNLANLNLSNFDTSKVTNMYGMFDGMHNLANLNLSNFDTSKVTNMGSMFLNIKSLTSLNLSNFDTSKVTNMKFMFAGMSSLITLDLSNFNTSKVTDISAMFAGTPSLITLDLSNFDTSQVTDMTSIFALQDEEAPNDKLEKIYVNNDFDTSKLTGAVYGIFDNRKKLRGGNGSYLSNPFTADKSWLRVDRPGVQGYFTRKT